MTHLGAKTRSLSFNRTQSSVITGLLTGHNTLRRHLHLMGLTNSPLCKRCGAEDKTSAHILCECVAVASLVHVHLGSFFLEPKDIKCVSLEANWNFDKRTGPLEMVSDYGAQRAHQLRPGCIRTVGAWTRMPINQSGSQSILGSTYANHGLGGDDQFLHMWFKHLMSTIVVVPHR